MRHRALVRLRISGHSWTEESLAQTKIQWKGHFWEGKKRYSKRRQATRGYNFQNILKKNMSKNGTKLKNEGIYFDEFCMHECNTSYAWRNFVNLWQENVTETPEKQLSYQNWFKCSPRIPCNQRVISNVSNNDYSTKSWVFSLHNVAFNRIEGRIWGLVNMAIFLRRSAYAKYAKFGPKLKFWPRGHYIDRRFLRQGGTTNFFLILSVTFCQSSQILFTDCEQILFNTFLHEDGGLLHFIHFLLLEGTK